MTHRIGRLNGHLILIIIVIDYLVHRQIIWETLPIRDMLNDHQTAIAP